MKVSNSINLTHILQIIWAHVSAPSILQTHSGPQHEGTNWYIIFDNFRNWYDEL